MSHGQPSLLELQYFCVATRWRCVTSKPLFPGAVAVGSMLAQLDDDVRTVIACLIAQGLV